MAALLRRGGRRPGPGKVRMGPLEIDPLGRQVWLHGEDVKLSKKEFALLRALAGDPTRVFTREEGYQPPRKLYSARLPLFDRCVSVSRRALRCLPNEVWVRYVRGVIGVAVEAAARLGSG